MQTLLSYSTSVVGFHDGIKMRSGPAATPGGCKVVLSDPSIRRQQSTGLAYHAPVEVFERNNAPVACATKPMICVVALEWNGLEPGCDASDVFSIELVMGGAGGETREEAGSWAGLYQELTDQDQPLTLTLSSYALAGEPRLHVSINPATCVPPFINWPALKPHLKLCTTPAGACLAVAQVPGGAHGIGSLSAVPAQHVAPASTGQQAPPDAGSSAIPKRGTKRTDRDSLSPSSARVAQRPRDNGDGGGGAAAVAGGNRDGGGHTASLPAPTQLTPREQLLQLLQQQPVDKKGVAAALRDFYPACPPTLLHQLMRVYNKKPAGADWSEGMLQPDDDFDTRSWKAHAGLRELEDNSCMGPLVKSQLAEQCVAEMAGLDQADRDEDTASDIDMLHVQQADGDMLQEVCVHRDGGSAVLTLAAMRHGTSEIVVVCTPLSLQLQETKQEGRAKDEFKLVCTDPASSFYAQLESLWSTRPPGRSSAPLLGLVVGPEQQGTPALAVQQGAQPGSAQVAVVARQIYVARPLANYTLAQLVNGVGQGEATYTMMEQPAADGKVAVWLQYDVPDEYGPEWGAIQLHRGKRPGYSQFDMEVLGSYGLGLSKEEAWLVGSKAAAEERAALCLARGRLGLALDVWEGARALHQWHVVHHRIKLCNIHVSCHGGLHAHLAVSDASLDAAIEPRRLYKHQYRAAGLVPMVPEELQRCAKHALGRLSACGLLPPRQLKDLMTRVEATCDIYACGELFFKYTSTTHPWSLECDGGSCCSTSITGMLSVLKGLRTDVLGTVCHMRSLNVFSLTPEGPLRDAAMAGLMDTSVTISSGRSTSPLNPW